ncbi:hypothetical protein Patl1_34876 [Pistacia atlantica]|uniref:Uncharacterized protein n=1 Tax=Pistacia atlantica TaxID=434234 RepID=A0ACC0ZU10_9ROSI|nr:hypothetical protein Patl1_34876 [Pistacia atlantica]
MNNDRSQQRYPTESCNPVHTKISSVSLLRELDNANYRLVYYYLKQYLLVHRKKYSE